MTSDDLKCEVVYSDGRVVVRLGGALDYVATNKLMSTLQAALAFSPNELILDVRGVTFIGSAGLSVLSGGLAYFVEAGGVVTLRPSPRFMRVLSLVGMDEVWRVDWSDGDL